MQAQAYDRIDDVPAHLWDAGAPEEFFFRRSFLRVMEESAVEDARYRYLVLRDGARPAGLAVLSRFVLRLDLLAERLTARLGRWRPRALDVPMVCCGIPASFGQHHLHLGSADARAAAVAVVHGEMERWAAASASRLLVWKEWAPAQGLCESARRHGYLALPTLPDHVVSQLPDSIDAFLDRLRSPYRRKYRCAAALLRGDGPVWTSGPLRLEEQAFTAAAAGDFHRGYLSVLRRARVRLETYPEAFFIGLAGAGLGARTLSLAHAETGQALTALLLPSGTGLTFALVAKDRARYDDALYTLLLQCIVLYAVRRGFAQVRLGQTSSYAKCSVGAAPRRLETFLQVRGSLGHHLLRCLAGLLFPEATWPRLRVFKEDARRTSALAEGGAA